MEAEIQQRPKTIVLVVIGLFVFFVCAGAVAYVWAQHYEGRIAPNVFIGPVEVSGLEPETAQRLLQTKIDQILLRGIDVGVGDMVRTLPLATVGSGDSNEDIKFDLDQTIEEAIRVPFLKSIWRPVTIDLSVTILEENIKKNIVNLFPNQEKSPQNSRFLVSGGEGGPVIKTTPDVSGTTFVWNLFFAHLSERLTALNPYQIELPLANQLPEVTQEMAESQLSQALDLLFHDFLFVYENEHGKKFEWELKELVTYKKAIISWGEQYQYWDETMLIPQANGHVGMDQVMFDAFLDPIGMQIERPAQNARIEIENGRVVAFVGSQSGRRLDRNAVREEVVRSFTQSVEQPIKLIVIVEEPTVQTKDVNDLGIDQILGVGTSSYRGSPTNRRKNIQNGVNLLNGILIPPGETFSLLNALKPFEIANGYLPELVIKGNKIIPEIGGGLCQIGTTTFRTAMNSGMPIVERQNHSLVVSYYNDPSNNNPGTDATIYEPAPDFKFLNDTTNFILFQAENLIDTQELRFTFWGTADGRRGSYTPPVVQGWIPVGETQYTFTTDLEPGKEKCQEAHIGANASFDYTIVRPDGTVEATTFTSHYRPLPRFCLVGAFAVPPPLPDSTTPSLPDSITPSLPDLSTE